MDSVWAREYWNHGFWPPARKGLRLGEDNGLVRLENQNKYNCIDFLVIAAYFLGRKQKWMSVGHHYKM
jgi:hypothetical protein